MNEKELAQEVLNKVQAAPSKYRVAAIFMAVLIIVIAGYLAWQHFFTSAPQPVTVITQKQAETPQGVDLAAKNAKLEMMQSQLDEAAAQIAYLKNKPPEKVIITEVKEVVKVVEKEVTKSGADFAILTDPANPDKKVGLKEIEALPEGTIVTLNQYNVFAYKKVIRGVNVFPALDSGRVKINEVTFDVSRRISKGGKYVGVVVGYDIENNKAKAGIRYSF